MRRASWLGLVGGLAVLLGIASVSLAAPVQQGSAVISSPHGPVTVRGSVLVSGTATHPSFLFYKVEWAPGNSPRDDQWVTIGSTHATPVTNGLLETWHTHPSIPDGVYSLRLRVVRRDGNYDDYVVRQITVANNVPTETPTPAQAQPKPTQPTSTPMPATPTIMIEMPVTVTPQPRPTSSRAVPQATPAPVSLSLDRMASSALWGGGIALGAFVLIGLLALVRQVFRLIVYR